MTDIDPSAPTVLRLGEPEDLLSAIPYLLKYHPDRSLVFLLLDGRRLVVTARIGIDLEDEPDPRALADYLQLVCADHGADGLVLVAYFPEPEWASGLIVDIITRLEGPLVHTALVADGERWWSCFCDHEVWEDCDCDDHVGTPYDVSTTSVAAQAVLAGLAVQPSRESLAQSVAGPLSDDARRSAAADIEGALETVSQLNLEARCDRMALLVERHCVGGDPLTDRDCAELAVLAYEGVVRDVAAERMQLSDAAAHVELWHRVVARTVAPFESAPLCLLGLAGWLTGHGALQVVCMERAERINPDYSLLRVLDGINAQALHPSRWQELRAS